MKVRTQLQIIGPVTQWGDFLPELTTCGSENNQRSSSIYASLNFRLGESVVRRHAVRARSERRLQQLPILP